MRRWVSHHPLLAVVLVAVLALATGLGLARFVISPSQAAVDAPPPELTTLTAPVVREPIHATVPADAQIVFSTSIDIVPASPGEGALPVVTAIHHRLGEQVNSGEALLDVGGRPTLVLQGTATAFRTMGPGMQGADITQLQTALRALGYEIDADEGSYGSSTSAAVAKFYRDRGYEPVMVGLDDVEAARQAHAAARRAENTAETGLRRAKRDRAANKQSSSDDAKDGTPDTSPDPGNNDAVEDARQELVYAREDLETAAEALSKAQSRAGAEVPVGEIAFIQSLPAKISSISLGVGRELGEGKVVLSAGDLVAKASIPQTLAPELATGAKAQIIATDGTQTEATLSAVTIGGKNDAGIPTWNVVAKPITKLKPESLNQTVRLSISLSGEDKPVLQVPESAVQTRPDGKTVVEVEDSDEQHRDVEVAIGGSGDGQVAVAPTSGGTLVEGDLVVIGRSQ